MTLNTRQRHRNLVTILAWGCVMLCMAGTASGHGAGEAQPSFDASAGAAADTADMFMSEPLSRQLDAVRALMEKDQYREAVARLEAMDARSDSYNRYENAILHQTLGYAYASIDDYAKAAAAFEEALSFKALPGEAARAVMGNLGQLYIATERYDKGIAVLEDWMAGAKPAEIAPQMRLLLGNAYLHQGAYAKAAAQVKQAVTAAEHPDKSWFQLLASVYQQWGHYDEMADALQQAVAAYPGEKAFWQQLAGAYRLAHQDKKAAAVLALACDTGICDDNDKIYLARLYLYLGAPLKSAHLIQTGIDDGSLAGDADQWLLLAQSWQLAREPDRAVTAYTEAAKRSKDSGDADLRLGQIYVQQERWQAAAGAFSTALKKGHLTNPGRAHLLLGVAQFYLGQPQQAAASLSKAAEYKDVEKQARRWLAQIRPAS
jgi:tetratricopeptide (TPR) repeat protein